MKEHHSEVTQMEGPLTHEPRAQNIRRDYLKGSAVSATRFSIGQRSDVGSDMEKKGENIEQELSDTLV
jgi:hypothetical protein